MINYYKKSEKAFKNFIKKNPHCSKEEWDIYAQKNCLLSANTLMFHLHHEGLIKYLNKKNIDGFEYLKNMFLFVPIKYRDNKVFKTFFKIVDKNREHRIIEKD